MSDIDTLTELFMRFPGIGPRQAKRFVFFLLRQDAGYRNALTRAITDVVSNIKRCEQCLRFAPLHAQKPICNLCADSSREKNLLMVVEKDTDIDQIEKSDSYNGQYFVLGGTLSLTGKKGFIREKELFSHFKKQDSFAEIILALSATPDGEYTTDYLQTKFKEDEHVKEASVTILGRGLSTGSELEYADADTLTQALKNRA
ncbi:MAG: recombination protein RecR [Candidatus Pacebacteria bacterium]|nr:recombination protein RecR [Candidatus Paceibacterota bacterium]